MGVTCPPPSLGPVRKYSCLWFHLLHMAWQYLFVVSPISVYLGMDMAQTFNIWFPRQLRGVVVNKTPSLRQIKTAKETSDSFWSIRLVSWKRFLQCILFYSTPIIYSTIHRYIQCIMPNIQFFLCNITRYCLYSQSENNWCKKRHVSCEGTVFS